MTADEGDVVGGGPFVTGTGRHDRADVVRRLREVGLQSPSVSALPAFAAQLLGTASAHVALVSDVEPASSGAGGPVPAVAPDRPVHETLCAHVVATGAVVSIEDAAVDPRVSLTVTEGTVGAFLGVPLRVRGQVVGAVCVFDPRPREWRPDDVEVLQRLVAPVSAELELTALGADYQNERLLWQLAVDAAGVGAFDWNLETDELRWDERLLEIFGLDLATFGGTIQAFNDCVHPDDRDTVGQALSRAIDTCNTYEAEYRIDRPDGSVRWISARGRALAGPDGRATRLLGAAYDITSAEEGEASVRRVLEAMPSAFFHLDRDWRFSYVNAHAARMLGQGALGAEIVGAQLWDLFPDVVGSDSERYYRQAVESGEPVHFEAFYAAPLERWYEVRAWPSPEGLAVYFLDVTDRRHAMELTETSRQRSDLLGRLSDALTGTLNAEDAAVALAATVVGPLADWCVVTLIDHPTLTSAGSAADGGPSRDWRRGLRDVAGWHVASGSRAWVDRYVEGRIEALTDSSFVARVLATREQVVIEHRATAEIAEVLAPGVARDALTALGPGSAVIAPLQARGRVLGVLSVFRDVERAGFSPVELQLLGEVADRAGLTLDNARLYGEQRELAEGLQRILLTDPPPSSYLEIAARYSPAAEQAEVGGDWYDAFVLADGETCVVVIGDVAGHDTRAAADMGQLRGLLRGVAMSTDAGPAEILQGVDGAMQTLRLDTTATAVVARFALAGATPATEGGPGAGSVRLTWSNAGHPPPALVTSTRSEDPDGPRVQLLTTADHLLLGLDPTTARDGATLALEEGDVVVFYTDGLVERRGAGIDEGIDRLVRTLPGLVAGGASLASICDRLVRELVPPAPEDDAAIIAVRVRPRGGEG